MVNVIEFLEKYEIKNTLKSNHKDCISHLQELGQGFFVILFGHGVGGPQLLHVGVVGLDQGAGAARAVLAQVHLEGHAVVVVTLKISKL